jgi:hypothetical protein
MPFDIIKSGKSRLSGADNLRYVCSSNGGKVRTGLKTNKILFQDID